jgi:hypothetical protein
LWIAAAVGAFDDHPPAVGREPSRRVAALAAEDQLLHPQPQVEHVHVEVLGVALVGGVPDQGAVVGEMSEAEDGLGPIGERSDAAAAARQQEELGPLVAVGVLADEQGVRVGGGPADERHAVGEEGPLLGVAARRGHHPHLPAAGEVGQEGDLAAVGG